jgi:branched-chain amino acid transport system ATP-binding protein
MTAVIELRDIPAGYGRIDVLHGVSFSVTAGSVLVVLGPNGAGKSTTVHTIAGLNRPSSGSIFVCGHDVTGAPPDVLARGGLCVIPQGQGVFPASPWTSTWGRSRAATESCLWYASGRMRTSRS